MAMQYLHERFDNVGLDSRLSWRCEPHRWSLDPVNRCLRIEPDGGTDFWQTTHYGFQADNGHLLLARISSDFVVTTGVRCHPVHQYDQAGLMVRISPSCWLKTSIEYEPDGPSRLGAVVTNQGYSDWSTQPVPAGLREICLRVRREGTDYLVEASPEGKDWDQIRMAHLYDDRDGAAVECGLYVCSPKGAGYVAEFSFFHIDVERLP
jgi:regulation of enolase protein 1 (concanavalin A-like superfamily)